MQNHDFMASVVAQPEPASPPKENPFTQNEQRAPIYPSAHHDTFSHKLAYLFAGAAISAAVIVGIYGVNQPEKARDLYLNAKQTVTDFILKIS